MAQNADPLPPNEGAPPSGGEGYIRIPPEQYYNPLSVSSIHHYMEESLLVLLACLIGLMLKLRKRN